MIVLPVELQQPPHNLHARLLRHVTAFWGATLQLYVRHADCAMLNLYLETKRNI